LKEILKTLMTQKLWNSCGQLQK
ncbi:MAG TPA: hypothetical protein DCM40_39385, partial [Maribacter sp.]|nr:hypothetical protein [Maribacter sp.]